MSVAVDQWEARECLTVSWKARRGVRTGAFVLGFCCRTKGVLSIGFCWRSCDGCCCVWLVCGASRGVCSKRRIAGLKGQGWSPLREPNNQTLACFFGIRGGCNSCWLQQLEWWALGTQISPAELLKNTIRSQTVRTIIIQRTAC